MIMLKFVINLEFVGEKIAAALSQGLKVVSCVGVTLAQREAGTTTEVVAAQTQAIVNAPASELKKKLLCHRIYGKYDDDSVLSIGLMARGNYVQHLTSHLKEFFNVKGKLWRLRDAHGKPPGVIGWWPSRSVTFLNNQGMLSLFYASLCHARLLLVYVLSDHNRKAVNTTYLLVLSCNSSIYID
nr:triosephosphate isomerase, cytosolic-like [Tanacetum cinerariifolium]